MSAVGGAWAGWAGPEPRGRGLSWVQLIEGKNLPGGRGFVSSGRGLKGGIVEAGPGLCGRGLREAGRGFGEVGGAWSVDGREGCGLVKGRGKNK